MHTDLHAKFKHFAHCLETFEACDLYYHLPHFNIHHRIPQGKKD